VVISGDVGMHRPQPEIFLLEAERVGAVAVGMTAVLHRGAESTCPSAKSCWRGSQIPGSLLSIA
jgi:hypothetical protein